MSKHTYKKKIGFVVGKFMPFHKGHALLLDFASNFVDELHVAISTDTPGMSVQDRSKIIEQRYRNKTVYVHQIDETGVPSTGYDEKGTATSDAFWHAWIELIRQHIPNSIDYVFSSDAYGKKLAQLLRSEWIPVDAARTVFTTSGTKIRNSLFDNWQYLAEETQNALQKRVAVVGPESCGKTTMCKKLADYFGIKTYPEFVPEYGRLYTESRGIDLDPYSFQQIIAGQQALNNSLTVSGPIELHDTETITTSIYAPQYTSASIPNVTDLIRNETFDHYLLLKPTVKWVDDGTRVQDQRMRDEFFGEMAYTLRKFKKPYTVIDQIEYDARFAQAVAVIKKLFPFQN